MYFFLWLNEEVKANLQILLSTSSPDLSNHVSERSLSQQTKVSQQCFPLLIENTLVPGQWGRDSPIKAHRKTIAGAYKYQIEFSQKNSPRSSVNINVYHVILLSMAEATWQFPELPVLCHVSVHYVYPGDLPKSFSEQKGKYLPNALLNNTIL